MNNPIVALSCKLLNTFQKLCTPKIAARFAFFFVDNFCYFRFGGDCRVVSSGNPKGSFAFHAMITNKNVFDRKHHRVTHVQSASYVGRREHNAKRFCGFFGHTFFDAHIRIKKTTLLPEFVDIILHLLRLVRFWNFSHRSFYFIITYPILTFG